MKSSIAVIDTDGRREYTLARLPLPVGADADDGDGIVNCLPVHHSAVEDHQIEVPGGSKLCE